MSIVETAPLEMDREPKQKKDKKDKKDKKEKKSKKGKGVNIEDMYSFDADLTAKVLEDMRKEDAERKARRAARKAEKEAAASLGDSVEKQAKVLEDMRKEEAERKARRAARKAEKEAAASLGDSVEKQAKTIIEEDEERRARRAARKAAKQGAKEKEASQSAILSRLPSPSRSAQRSRKVTFNNEVEEVQDGFLEWVGQGIASIFGTDEVGDAAKSTDTADAVTEPAPPKIAACAAQEDVSPVTADAVAEPIPPSSCSVACDVQDAVPASADAVAEPVPAACGVPVEVQDVLQSSPRVRWCDADEAEVVHDGASVLHTSCVSKVVEPSEDVPHTASAMAKSRDADLWRAAFEVTDFLGSIRKSLEQSELGTSSSKSSLSADAPAFEFSPSLPSSASLNGFNASAAVFEYNPHSMTDILLRCSETQPACSIPAPSAAPCVEKSQEEGSQKNMGEIGEIRDTAPSESQKAMDKVLWQCFLQAATTRVKDRDLPIMGTTLYGKHMRMCRRIGTSCDVKETSFAWLRPFLEHLEDQGLIALMPNSQDPMVTEIFRNHSAIWNWKPWAYRMTAASERSRR